MPAIHPPSKILVTGASGFLATTIISHLRTKNYSVVGTVRRESKGEYLKQRFGINYVVVEDMEAEGAFDKAVEGVDAVFHTATVMDFSKDTDSIVKPAVAGTLGILESVKNHGSNVRRIVITSSLAAVGGGHNTGATVPTEDGTDESSWNDVAVDAALADPANVPPMVKYGASKVLAERAAWEFVEKHKDVIGFDIVTICPPIIWGPLLTEGTDLSNVTGSMGMLLKGLATPRSNEELAQKAGNMIDVRDLSAAHVEVLAREEAGNERYIIIHKPYTWQDVFDAVNEAKAVPGLSLGQPGATKDKVWARPSTEKYRKLVSKPSSEVYRPFEETVVDSVKALLERGWVPFAESK